VHQAEFQLFLEADHVLGADDVRPPQLFVEVFTVPAAEFRRRVIDTIERPKPLENPLDLAVLSQVAASVARMFFVGSQRESDFLGPMGNIDREGAVAT